MPQTSPQSFTPLEILQAGRRAEAEGRPDHAAQFYRHLTDFYARTREAVEAREGLRRLNVPAPDPEAGPDDRGRRSLAEALPHATSMAGNGAKRHTTQPAAGGDAVSEASMSQPASGTRRRSFELPPPAQGYRLGRTLAWLLVGLGWLLVAAGPVLLFLGLGMRLDTLTLEAVRALGPALSMAGLVSLSGLALVLIGLAAHAVFRTANASVDAAALARARAMHNAGHTR